MALLDVYQLVKRFGRRKVVDGVSYQVDHSEIVGLLGPNGAGKTTTFRMTIGMLTPNGGKVQFTGQDVTRWPMYKRARQGLGYLAQEPSIFRKLTVMQNLEAILETLRMSRSQQRMRAEQLMAQFGLQHLARARADTLSGGERRRLEISRSLITEPKLLLLDEPFTGVDPKAIADIQQIIRDLRARGLSILLTDHNVRETLKITDRSYIISDGKILSHGTPTQILTDKLARQHYLGEGFDTAGLMEDGVAQGNMISDVMQEDEIGRLIGKIVSKRTSEWNTAMSKLAELGEPAVPKLVEALEHRERDIRHRAKQALVRIVGPFDFDPYANPQKRITQVLRQRQELGVDAHRDGG